MMNGGQLPTNPLHDISEGALDHVSCAPQLMSCIYYLYDIVCVCVCIMCIMLNTSFKKWGARLCVCQSTLILRMKWDVLCFSMQFSLGSPRASIVLTFSTLSFQRSQRRSSRISLSSLTDPSGDSPG